MKDVPEDTLVPGALVTGDLVTGDLVETRGEATAWLTDMTGCSAQHAAIALHRAGWEISDALDILPSVQSMSTEAEVRALIDTADATATTARPLLVDGRAARSTTATPQPLIDTAPQPPCILIDDSDSEEEDKREGAGCHDAKREGAGCHDAIVLRVARATATTHARARAALNLTNNEEQAAVDVILRQRRQQPPPPQHTAAAPQQNRVTQHSSKRKRMSDSTTTSDSDLWDVEDSGTNILNKELLLVSWNIDGLCERGLSERFSAVISTIKSINPHVVLLQEVVHEHVDRIRQQLGRTFDVTFGDRAASSYFNAILVNKTKGCKKESGRVRSFPSSIMGRHSVQVECKINNKTFVFFTAHIESLREHASERAGQINQVLEQMSLQDAGNIVIFGGDTNLRQSDKVTLPSGFYDAWEAAGRDPSTKNTWDTAANHNTNAKFRSQMRFDRIFVRRNTFLEIRSFRLLGKSKLLSCDMFPSDHWGLLATFQLPS